MILLKTGSLNKMVVTVSQNAELLNPEWLFSFTHIFSKQQVNFVLPNLSVHKKRYDEFEFTEGTGVGEIAFPYEGQYTYRILEQVAQIPTNTNPALAYNTVEWGTALLMATTGETTNDYYVEYISNNEDNSNYIFAPDELNPTPTPSITPSATATPVVTSTPTPTLTVSSTNTPTPTPSVTPTLTPTLTSTITPTITQTPSSSSTPAITSSATPTMTPTPSTTPISIDPDAAAYLSAVLSNGGTLNATISAATDTLFSSLKSAGIYSKIFGMYPFLGGVANSCRLNAVNLANNITWYGGMSFNSSGATGDGINGYGDTNISHLTFPLDSISLGIYQITNNSPLLSEEILIGSYNPSSLPALQLGTNLTALSNNAFYRCGSTSNSQVSGLGQKGIFIINRNNSTNSSLFFNGSLSNTLGTSYSLGAIAGSVYLFNFNLIGSPYANSYANQQLGFAYMSEGLTNSEVTNLTNIINTWATTLNRNTY